MASKGYWKPLAKERVKALKKSWGAGWDKLGPDLREALVAREIVSVLLTAALPSTLEANPELASMHEMAREFYAAHLAASLGG